MDQKIEAPVPPAIVWAAWEKAHTVQGGLVNGYQGKMQGKQKFCYQVFDVVPGQQFSILWKTLFVRLIFTHTVQATQRGSEICYGFKIGGPFAWPMRWMLGKKISSNLALVLQSFVKKL